MREVKVFISYRRDVDLLRASLVSTMIRNFFVDSNSPVEVYLDRQSRLGQTWPDEIRREIATSSLVLILLGPGWLAAKDRFERRRIDQPDDWVRQEIELALANSIPIIPITFESRLPESEALPIEIRDMLTWQAASAHDATIDRDLEPVLMEIQRLQHEVNPQPSRNMTGNRLPYPNPPMKVPPTPMPSEEIELVLSEMLPGWELVRSEDPRVAGVHREELSRTFVFAGFLEAISFMQLVADFAEKANHRPRWENIFKTLFVNLTTWDIGHRVSHLDVMLASHFDRQYEMYTKARS